MKTPYASNTNLQVAAQKSSSAGSDRLAGWLRPVVLIAVPLIAVAIAFLLVGDTIPLLFVLAFVGALVVGVFGLRHASNQNVLFAAIAAGGLLGFFALPTGTQSRVPISLVIVIGIAGMWLLAILTKQVKRPILRPTPVNGAVLAYLGVNLLSFAWSTLIRDPLVWMPFSFTIVQVAAFVVNCLLPLVILIVINKVDGMEFWSKAVWFTILIAAFGIWSEILGLPTVAMTSNGMNGLMPMWAGGFAFSLLVFNTKLSWLQRFVLVAVIAGFIWRNMIGNTGWLSGWIPLVVILAVILWFRSKVLFVLALVITLAVATAFMSEIYDSVVQSNLDEGSGSRIEIWEISMRHVMAHPLLGSGPAGYAAYYMNYHPTNARSTHNNFFDVIAQTGFVGLVLFLNMMIRLVVVGFRNVSATKSSGDGFRRAFAVATLSAIPAVFVGMMLGDWVLPFAYNQTITGFDHALITWLYLGGIASMYWLMSTESASISTEVTTDG